MIKKDPQLKERCRNIKLLIMDVDGVLTNGQIIYDSSGKEIKCFNVQDGYGIMLWHRVGLKTAILSARSSKPVTIRAKDLKIDQIVQDAYPKLKAYKKLLQTFNLKDHQACFVGDDLPDLAVLECVGFAVTVADGNEEVKRKAHYVTNRPGGSGAVREVIELILKEQKKWRGILEGHLVKGKKKR